MKHRTIILICLLAITLSACNGSSLFLRNQMIWKNHQIHHYRFTISISCFCPYAGMLATYEVQNGQIVSRSFSSQDGGQFEEERVAEIYEPFSNIDKVFNYVSAAISDADEVSIEYDPEYGFPRTISIDWIEMAIDDEMYLTLSDFEPLP